MYNVRSEFNSGIVYALVKRIRFTAGLKLV